MLEFEDEPETLLTKLTDSVKAIFSRQQASDAARFSDVNEAVTAIAVQVQTNGESAESRFNALNSELASLKQSIEEQVTANKQQFSAIDAVLEKTPSGQQARRKLSTGGDAESVDLTDC